MNYKLQTTNHTKGFTLIELLMAIGIGSLLFGIGMARYTDFNRTQTLKSAGLNMKNNLRKIQAKANSGVKPCLSIESLDGYRVSQKTTLRYDVNSLCDNTPGHLESYSFSANSNLRFVNAGIGFANFDILPINQGISAPSLITIRYGSLNQFYQICVKTSGEIADCGYGTSVPICSCS